MTPKAPIPDVLKFDSLRDYLCEVLISLKTHQRYSQRSFAARMGFKSTGFLPMVLKGKRNFSFGSAKKLAVFLGLKENEEKYLFILTEMALTKDPGRQYQLRCESEVLRSPPPLCVDLPVTLKDWPRIRNSIVEALKVTEESRAVSSTMRLQIQMYPVLPELPEEKHAQRGQDGQN